MLEDLNLSYNPLSDACALYVSSLVKHCPLLAKLSLQSCDLSMKFFQLHRRALSEAFQGSYAIFIPLGHCASIICPPNIVQHDKAKKHMAKGNHIFKIQVPQKCHFGPLQMTFLNTNKSVLTNIFYYFEAL